MRYLLLILFSIACFTGQSQTKDSVKYPAHHLFGNIFTDFRHDFTNHTTPHTAFELSTALLGYKVNVSKDIKATLIYDVTHTTGNISVSDTNGTSMNVLYSKGSEYTAFLKMAEIDWQFAPNFELSAGQLLNQQYLTIQDKFWGYRFIAVTAQEMYRFGYPADFGMRLTYRHGKIFNWSIGAVNGDGPFFHQDDNSTILFQNNIEYRPLGKFIVKLYSGFEQKADDPIITNALFLAYRIQKFRIGLEYNRVDHNASLPQYNKEGASLYGSYAVTKKIDLLARYDYLMQSGTYRYDWMGLAGFNYHKNKLNTGLNFRYFTATESFLLYWSFGIFF